MKSIIGGSIIAVLLVCLTLPSLVFAEAEGATAGGFFKFALEDGEIRFVEFNATERSEGQAVGEMTLSDPAVVPVADPDDSERPRSPGVLVRARFDCMNIDNNTAVIGGEIFESNVPDAIGMRVLLVVEDNGVDGARDRVTWGISQPPPARGWTPTDSERDDDNGASLTWWATDSERRDDVGIPMPAGRLGACKTFPLASFDFPEIKYAGGDLKVSQR